MRKGKDTARARNYRNKTIDRITMEDGIVRYVREDGGMIPISENLLIYARLAYNVDRCIEKNEFLFAELSISQERLEIIGYGSLGKERSEAYEELFEILRERVRKYKNQNLEDVLP